MAQITLESRKPSPQVSSSSVFLDFNAGSTTSDPGFRIPCYCSTTRNASLLIRICGKCYDDGLENSSGPAKKIGEGGVHIVTSFTYVTETRNASFRTETNVISMLS